MTFNIFLWVFKAPANEEILLRKHFLKCFLAGLPKKLFNENRRLHMLNLGNTAYATTESSTTLLPRRANRETFVAETKCF